MLYIEDNVIKLTRGDNASLEIPIKRKLANGTTEPYTMDAEDVLKFSVKKSLKDATYSFQKTATGTNVINIVPNDTKSLEFTKYKYDVELTTSTGKVYTIIEPTTFEVLPEVTGQ